MGRPHAADMLETGTEHDGQALAEAIREARHWAAAAEDARQRLEALDAATIAISQELSIERVLQLIVDSVRPLVGARYAALGIPDEQGRMERFITSGISDAERHAIGHPPRGLGLLGEIIRSGRSVRVAVLADDPRSVGFPEHHPSMNSFLGVPVRVEGRVIGNLYLTEKEAQSEFSEDDERLVESFARHAGLAIHNARMHEELRHMAVLQERERIAQDLHDGSIQSLYAVSLFLEDANELMATDAIAVASRIERAIESIHETIRDIRAFIMGLDADAEPVDLYGGLLQLIEEFERTTLVEAELGGDQRVSLDAEETRQLIQLTREAMSNVARHAEASKVRVEVMAQRDQLLLSIIDDGRGFDPKEERRPGHHGLSNMQARAESIGGSLTIETSDAGTRVVFQMPRGHDSHHKEPAS